MTCKQLEENLDSPWMTLENVYWTNEKIFAAIYVFIGLISALVLILF